MGRKQQLPPYELRHLSLFPAGILNSLNSTRCLGRHLCHGAAGGTPSVATARCTWVWCANLTMRLRSWQKQGSLCWAPRLDQGLQNSSGPFQKDRGMIEKAGWNAEQTMEHWGNTSKKHQKNIKKHKKHQIPDASSLPPQVIDRVSQTFAAWKVGEGWRNGSISMGKWLTKNYILYILYIYIHVYIIWYIYIYDIWYILIHTHIYIYDIYIKER